MTMMDTDKDDGRDCGLVDQVEYVPPIAPPVRREPLVLRGKGYTVEAAYIGTDLRPLGDALLMMLAWSEREYVAEQAAQAAATTGSAKQP